MQACETFKAYRPRPGQSLSYRGEEVGRISSIEGNLCWAAYHGREPAPFIWCFKDGLNNLHDWPTKGDGPVCP